MYRIVGLCLILLAVACTRSTGPISVAPAKTTAGAPETPWNLQPARLPVGSQALGKVALSRYFPLAAAFTRQHGTGAGMSAWKIPVNEQFWWVVDTRYTFATEDDAARFLVSQQAQLSEGHRLIEDRLALSCDPAAKLFLGRIIHPGLGTPFFAFVAVGRYRHHVFKFLAAVEDPSGDALQPAETPTIPLSEDALRPDFLALAERVLKP